MTSHLVIDGNAFYEIDDECMRKQERLKKQEQKEQINRSDLSIQKKKYRSGKD